jgi:hypothetical protein
MSLEDFKEGCKLKKQNIIMNISLFNDEYNRLLNEQSSYHIDCFEPRVKGIFSVTGIYYMSCPYCGKKLMVRETPDPESARVIYNCGCGYKYARYCEYGL